MCNTGTNSDMDTSVYAECSRYPQILSGVDGVIYMECLFRGGPSVVGGDLNCDQNMITS